MGLVNMDRYKIINDFFNLVFREREYDKEFFKNTQEKIYQLQQENRELRKKCNLPEPLHPSDPRNQLNEN